MAIDTRIFPEENALVATAADVVTGEDIVDFLFWLINEHRAGRLQDGYRLLLDAGDAGGVQVTEADIHRLSQINMTYGRERGNLKTAIVVDGGPGRELAFLHKSLAKLSGVEVEVFKSCEAAHEWLGFTPPSADVTSPARDHMGGAE